MELIFTCCSFKNTISVFQRGTKILFLFGTVIKNIEIIEFELALVHKINFHQVNILNSTIEVHQQTFLKVYLQRGTQLYGFEVIHNNTSKYFAFQKHNSFLILTTTPKFPVLYVKSILRYVCNTFCLKKKQSHLTSKTSIYKKENLGILLLLLIFVLFHAYSGMYRYRVK